MADAAGDRTSRPVRYHVCVDTVRGRGNLRHRLIWKGSGERSRPLTRVILTLMFCALCGRTPRRCAAGSRLIETRTGPTYSRGNEAVPFGVMRAVERYSAVYLASSPVQEQDIQYVTGWEEATTSRSRPKNGRFPRDDREQVRTVYTVAQPVTDAGGFVAGWVIVRIVNLSFMHMLHHASISIYQIPRDAVVHRAAITVNLTRPQVHPLERPRGQKT